MSIRRKIRTAIRVYREQGLGRITRLASDQSRDLWRMVQFSRADAKRDGGVRAAFVSEVVNFRLEFGHLPIDPSDVASCRKPILSAYMRHRFEACADICAAAADLSPMELCIYADCLYRTWGFAGLVDLADRLRTGLAGTKFLPRAEQTLRRAFMRVGRLTEAGEGLDAHNGDALDIGELMLRGDVYDALGRMDPATDAYDRAIHRQSDNPMLRLHYAFHLLKKGRHIEGLTNWGIADRMFGAYPLRPHRPLWRGEPLDGVRLLVLFEHGLGDMIQFARFFAPLQERYPSARLMGRVPRVLRDLLAASFPEVIFVADEEPEPSYDFYVPSVQLPVVLQATSLKATSLKATSLKATSLKATSLEAASLEPTSGYIALSRPSAARSGEQRSGRLRVGVCWRGHPRQYEQVRSIPLEVFSRLFAREDSTFVVLLNKLTEAEALSLARFPNVEVPPIRDFVDLGELISGCDVVVSVDTATVHVAAGAGRPVLLLARPDSCWRWGASGETSPWYPSVTILRHPVDLDWGAVLAETARRLDDLAAGHGPAPAVVGAAEASARFSAGRPHGESGASAALPGRLSA